jgi:hypothetical protein
LRRGYGAHQRPVKRVRRTITTSVAIDPSAMTAASGARIGATTGAITPAALAVPNIAR